MDPIYTIRIRAGGALIASNNIAKDALNVPMDKEKPVVMELQPEDGPFTVLGNIGTGMIYINTIKLGLPWQPLNVTLRQF